jgi:hypothetical protein
MSFLFSVLIILDVASSVPLAVFQLDGKRWEAEKTIGLRNRTGGVNLVSGPFHHHKISGGEAPCGKDVSAAFPSSAFSLPDCS